MKKIFTGILLTLLMVSCKKDIDSASGTEVKVKKEFNIQLWEKLTSTGGELQMIVNSIEPQACPNTHLDYYVSMIDNKVTVTLKNFTMPTNCTGAATYTRDTLSIGHLSNGAYKLAINLTDAVLNNGSLVVNNNLYVVDLQSENGIAMGTKQLSRIPENTIWGYVNYESSGTSKAQNFVDSLRALCQNLSLPNGAYGHFEVVNETLKMPPTTSYAHPFTTTFLFKYNGEEDKVNKLIQSFKWTNNALTIKMFSQTGKEY
ncbi:MAG: hypothetical protein RLZZ628_784 [Bacteroidota bacterium]|jgi:hypothetical protein